MQEMTGKCQTKASHGKTGHAKIAGPGKTEVNHVSGLIKTTNHREIDAESGMT